jgi:phosphoribosylanthranilate isomerase
LAPVVNVKICGLTTLEDARAALAAGADLLGFIFYAKSARAVDGDTVRAIVRAVRADVAAARRTAPNQVSSLPLFTPAPRLPRMVGVFVNAPLADVRHALEFCRLDYAQLHGDEPVDDLFALGGRAYKAIRPAATARALSDAALYSAQVRHRGPHLLVDAYDPAAYGGTGTRGDWALAARVAGETRRMLLAGGLTAANVADAVRTVRPWGVDVSSGVESSPGHKDHDAIRRFIANARAA